MQRKKCIKINLKKGKMIQEQYGKYLDNSVPAAKRDQQKVVKELKLMKIS